MFAWSRGEVWLAVVVSALLFVGGAAHLWLTYERLQGAAVIVEAASSGASEGELEVCDDVPASADESASDAGGGSVGTSNTGAFPRIEEMATDESAAADHRININIAPPSELQRLPGIGPALAARIVAYREAWGRFSTVEDIMEVSGIGPRTFENIRELIKVD